MIGVTAGISRPATLIMAWFLGTARAIMLAGGVWRVHCNVHGSAAGRPERIPPHLRLRLRRKFPNCVNLKPRGKR
jgi:hypothetical protein